MGMARLFVAVWPPEDVISELTGLHRKDQLGIRFVPPENWHITLRFIGDADPDQVIEALDGATLPRADARLGPAVDMLAERALVIPAAGLDDLSEAVTDLTAHIGKPTRKRFFGHLTLARVKTHVAMPRTLGTLVNATFEVDEIALVQSRLDPAGARYETIETWPLA
jgi:RNA 2',3'-cyclic 3'-phosphodiesterase